MRKLRSKISSKAQTVLPREVRERLGVSPGDTLRYTVTDAGVLIEKDEPLEFGPFSTFTEWASEEDERAFAQLQPGYVPPK